MKPTVIIVDDDPEVVRGITAFLESQGAFEIAGFSDPAEAELYAKANPVDVVVADYQMPQQDGLELLRRMKGLHPESSRILLASRADAHSSAIDGINQVALFQYLEKPWDDEQLLLAVQNGAERASLLRNLREKVDELDSAHNVLKGVQKRLVRAFL